MAQAFRCFLQLLNQCTALKEEVLCVTFPLSGWEACVSNRKQFYLRA